MDQLGDRVRHITNDLKEYIETKLELYLITASDKIAFLLGRTIQNTLGYAVLTIGLIFALISLSIFLGEVLGNEALGYLSVAAPMLLLGIILIVVKPKRIGQRVQELVMQEVLDALNEKDLSRKELPALNQELKKSSQDHG